MVTGLSPLDWHPLDWHPRAGPLRARSSPRSVRRRLGMTPTAAPAARDAAVALLLLDPELSESAERRHTDSGVTAPSGRIYCGAQCTRCVRRCAWTDGFEDSGCGARHGICSASEVAMRSTAVGWPALDRLQLLVAYGDVGNGHPGAGNAFTRARAQRRRATRARGTAVVRGRARHHDVRSPHRDRCAEPIRSRQRCPDVCDVFASGRASLAPERSPSQSRDVKR